MKNLKNKLGRLGMFAAALGLSSLSFGQTQTITTSVATGTGTNATLPIYGNFGYSYTQQIYLATDFAPAVAGQTSSITKLRFFNVSGSLTNSTDWTIYMGNTTQANFSSTTNWVPFAQLQQVFTGTLTAPAANTWMEITLATPFLWDGVSNVVLAIDENQPNFSNITWRTQSTGANRSISNYSDGTNPNPATPPTASARYGYVAQAQFVHEAVTTCSGTPAHTVAIASDADICEEDEVRFSLNNLPFVNGLTYVWQHNEGSGWVDFPDSDSTVYITSELNATGNIRAIVTCTASTLQDISEDVTVTVNPVPTVETDISSIAFCAGTSAEITASGADTYAWTPATGLTGASTAVVQANPTASTTYTVTGTTTAGCSSTATVKVFPLTNIERTAVFTPGENCEPGTPIALSVNVFPADIQGGASWEYRFLGPDGTTVIQDWNTNNTYNFIPTTDSVYSYFYEVRSNNCPDNTITPNKISIPVGFGAEAGLVHYDCNTLGGTITLSDAFGQSEIAEIYSNTLSDPTNAANITFTGAAGITGGRAVLTPSAMSSSGSMTVNIPGFTPGANNSMNVSFLMTMDTPINVGADGLTYSFGNDAVPTGSGNMQNGKGSKLRLSFDAIDNSTSNGNITGVYLVYGWTSATEFGPASNGVLAFSAAHVDLWKNRTDVPVSLSIDASGKATVTVDGTVLFSNVQMPAAYMNADVSTWKHLFTAGTGGYAFRQAVSNLSISAGSLKYGITPGNVTTAPATWQPGQVFESLAPGSYNIWIAKNETSGCNKNIGTFEILNLNPVVNLGNDTTICAGESLLLDAGNAGSTYVWSGTNIVTQTLEVDHAGSYVVYATDASGCLGIGTINVAVAEAPTATAIYSQGTYPTVFFAVTNPQNVDNYSWNFGDNTTIANGPSSVSHTYTEGGTYTVTVTISNDCGTETLTKQVTIVNTASIAENEIEGLKVYPNPASDKVNIQLPESMIASATVFSVTGAKIHEAENLQGMTQIDVQNWMKGIYFVHIQSEGKTSVTKLIIK